MIFLFRQIYWKEILKDEYSSFIRLLNFLLWNYRIMNENDRVTALISNSFFTSILLDSCHLFYTICCLLFLTSYFKLFEGLRGIIMIDTTEIFLVMKFIKWNEEEKLSKSNIFHHLLKYEKNKELEYETFNQLIANLLLSETILQRLILFLCTSRMIILLSKVLTMFL